MGEMSVLLLMGLLGLAAATARPRSILLDTDVDTDDFFALFYLLKQNRSEFDLKAVTISANAWSDAGHAVNHIYDILFMMDRDDVSVGVGGDGGVSNEGAILPNVGGYLPLIEQGITTVGYCRYRQAIPIGVGGRLHSDSNFGIRRGFLPQGHRKYTPLNQPTAQQVMIDTISAGPTTVFLIGSHTNFALFLMKNPHLKKNIERIYIMGGGVRSKNPTGCCPKNSSTSCKPQQCGDVGNLYTAYASNPYAEFNIFADPFAAYQSLYIVGGHIAGDYRDEGNLFTVPSNKYAEFNMYLDPLAAKTVFESDLEINLIPLHVQRQVTSFPKILIYLQLADKTPESEFSQQLLSLLHKLQQEHQVYHHMDIFLGEILGAVFLASQPYLDSQMQVKPVSVMTGNMSTDGQLFIDENNGKAVNILDNLNSEAYYNQYAKYLSEMNQSAVIGSFDQQKKQWSSPPH